MSEGFDINNLIGKVKDIAIKIDNKFVKDNKLSGVELSVFLANCRQNGIEVEKETWYTACKNLIDNQLQNLKNYAAKEEVAPMDAIHDYRADIKLVPNMYNNEDSEITLNNTQVSDMIKEEASERGVNLTSEEIEYWAEIVKNVANKYNIPEALLVAIIGQETNGTFEKNINSSNGAGPMQITKISIKDFFPGEKGNWNNVYNMVNQELLNDILYQKDENGNFKKNANGEYILKYKSAAELRDACTKDDELGIKVGLLCFEMKYVKAVAQKKYGRATYANVPKTVIGIKSGDIRLSEQENKSAVEIALKNYNSVFDSYAGTVLDSLSRYGLDFKDLYFIKQ